MYALRIRGFAVPVVSVLVLMMLAFDIGIIHKISGDVCLYGLVGRTAYSAEKGYSGSGNGILRSSAYSSADESINASVFEELSQSAVSASVCVDYLAGNYFFSFAV